jgi:ATP-dependent DNA helicase RecG
MPAKPKFDARKLMEKAIEVMRQSVEEPRQDGKACPRVGALLWKPDRTVWTACRGELRHGDHAEYALLERKNRANPLDGAILFTTMEPCSPGSRNPPKTSCAERIVLARITEVWVGIEDPDPMVDRKGIKYLQESGVAIRMFDRDLQYIIRKANKDFIAQAQARAAEADKKPKAVMLSTFESSAPAADMKDFSPEALKKYRDITKIKDSVDSEGFRQRFLQQGLLKQEKDRLVPSGFGLLLFGERPRDSAQQAGLLGTIHYPNEKEEIRDFDGPMVNVPDATIQWLKDKLPNPIDRSEARRREVSEKFFELVREGIVNALVHRNYDIAGAKCQLVVTPDTVVVKSPGRPIEPITLEQLQSFSAPMLSRNPLLHFIFAKMELAEERGLGLNSMKNDASQAGLPLPTYRWEDPYLVLTLFRSPASAVHVLSHQVLDSLNKDEKNSWSFIAGREFVTSQHLRQYMQFDKRKSQRVLQKLENAKLLRRVGKGPSTRYLVVRP